MKKIIYFSIVIFLLGCSAQKNYFLFQEQNSTKPIKKENQIKKISKTYIYQYKIAPGDRVSVTVFNHPELSTSSSSQTNPLGNSSNIGGIEVYPDGTITLPLIGTVKIAGLTQRQASEKLQKLYAKYLRHPFVKLTVLNKRVYVLGEVKKPGIVPVYGDYTTLIDAISQCGGFTEDAKKSQIKIISGNWNHPNVRIVNLTKLSANEASELILKPNSIVYVQPYNIKATDVKIKGIQPIVSFINSLLSTFVNIKVLSK